RAKSVGKLARAHPLEEVQIFLRRASAKWTLLSDYAVAVSVRGREIVHVRLAFGDELNCVFKKLLEIVRGAEWLPFALGLRLVDRRIQSSLSCIDRPQKKSRVFRRPLECRKFCPLLSVRERGLPSRRLANLRPRQSTRRTQFPLWSGSCHPCGGYIPLQIHGRCCSPKYSRGLKGSASGMISNTRADPADRYRTPFSAECFLERLLKMVV